MSDLGAVLEGYASGTLGTIARALRLAVRPGTSKDDLIAMIGPEVMNPKSIDRRLAALDPRDRQILDRLILRGGIAATVSLRKEAERQGLVEPRVRPIPSASGGRSQPDFPDVIERLTRAGLVFGERSSPGVISDLKSGAQVLLIPPEVRRFLPAVSVHVPEPVPVFPAATAEAASEMLQRDMFIYWRYVRRNQPDLTNRELVMKRHLLKIGEALSVREDAKAISSEAELGRTYFLRLVLEQVGLVRRQEFKLVLAPQAHAFLAKPRAERIRDSFAAWLAMKQWNELKRLDGLPIDFGRNSYRDGAPPLVLSARQFVVSLLKELPAGQWISLRHLWTLAQIKNYEFLLARDVVRGYYYYDDSDVNPYSGEENSLGWTFGARLKDDQHGWESVEGAFIAAVLREPLHWLGIVSLGYDDGRLTAFQITELGARIIRKEALPQEQSLPAKVVVQPNFQVFAFDPIGEDVLARLDEFADLVRAGQAIEFRLTRESVYRAQQAHVTVAEIVRFLEQVSGKPLPQNVHRTLEEWSTHHERIVVRPGVNVLHALNADELDGLLQDATLAPRLDLRLTPTAALVAQGQSIAALANALLEKGYLPALSPKDGGAVEERITIREDGRIAYRHALPNIYFRRGIAQFTEERDGQLWLTADSVQRATKEGLSADQIIARLTAFQRAPLAPEIIDRIKAWTGHWGKASIETLTIMKVRDQAVLAELLADETIGQFITPYPAEGALAIVDPESEGSLRAALRAKGIELENQASDHAGFIGSRTTRIFCVSMCHQARRIRPENRVDFCSREEATGAGFRACKLCQP